MNKENKKLPSVETSDQVPHWNEFDICNDLVDSLQANKFLMPTQVQARSLVHL